MHRFEVWAPRAKTVTLIHPSPVPMQGPDFHGWWRVQVPNAAAGADYGFSIDGSEPYPDPRSQRQPSGVHRLSRVYDQSSYQWNDSGFEAPLLGNGVLYELHVGTFTPEGTLDAAIGRLDHLVELGITHVELMPVCAFPGDRGWGYDGVALFAVHEAYGGPDALKRFVDAAHERGLAVLLDVVYNHFGPVGNYTGKFGPYLLESHRTPWGGAVNLEDSGAREVRRFFCDNALMWLRDFHIDGLRLDAVHAFVDRSAIHFLEQLAVEVKELAQSQGRSLVLIAESDLNDPRVVTPLEAGGLGMDAQWSDDFHHALFTVLKPGISEGYYKDFGKLEQLAKALEKTFVYDGTFSVHRNRDHGRPAGNLSQDKFVGFIQNHDQVGNRALGDRLYEIVGFERAKIAAAIVLLSPFVPLIFQGEEWAAASPFQYFADHEDAEMARLVSEGRKAEFQAFGWDPASIPDPENRATFERSKLNWEETGSGYHAEVVGWYRELIRLRRSLPDLQDRQVGHTKVSFAEEARWITMERGEMVVICNLGAERQSFSIEAGKRILLTSREEIAVEDRSVSLPPDTVVIVGR